MAALSHSLPSRGAQGLGTGTSLREEPRAVDGKSPVSHFFPLTHRLPICRKKSMPVCMHFVRDEIRHL